MALRTPQYLDRVTIWRNFVQDCQGSTAILFALVAMSLLAAVGAAVDHGNGLRVKAHLQNVLDAAVLAGAVDAKNTEKDVNGAISSYVMATYSASPSTPTVTASIVGNKLTGTAYVDIDNYFMQLFGRPVSRVAVDSAATLGVASPVEVALVFDTTDSMSFAPISGGATKINSAKAAAIQLVNALETAAGTSGNVKVGLVPFAEHVNIGTSYKGAPWLTGTEDVVEVEPETCVDTYPDTVYGPPVTRTGTCTRDGVSYSCTWTESPVISLGNPVNVCYPASTEVETWEGCVGSRNYPLDMQDGATATNPIIGVMEDCSDPLVRLTTDFTAIKSKINKLSTDDNTYIAPGLLWGWNLLSPSEPFADGAAYGGNTRKVIVLLTDGANTVSPDYPEHDESDSVLANARTAEVCRNIKAKKIEIFTIAFDVTDVAIKGILQNCASSPSNYFDTSTNEAMLAAFKKIAANLAASNTRLVR